jgi:LemA protein
VKGVTKQEDTVFISIANARARLSGAVQAGNVEGMAAANDQLSAGLGRLLAISENYPQLRSSENFRQLQDQLEGTENRIAVRAIHGRRGAGGRLRGSTSARRPVMKRSSAVASTLAMLAVLTAGCGYNTIQTMDERVNQAQGQIQAQLQRRADLIPNLVNTVKGVTKQEDTVFISIANARARLGGAIQSGNIPEMAAANAALNQGLGRLIAISENYPQLRSSENFKQLQDQLEGTENRISVARQDYNAAVGEYNAYIRRFPYNLTAKVFGLGKPREYFEAAAGAAEAPKVQF